MNGPKGSLAPCLVAAWSSGGLLETPPRRHATLYNEHSLIDHLFLVLDATAKIPSGILELKLHLPGDYELCENIFGEYNSAHTNKLEPLTGKYCRIDVGFASNVVSILDVRWTRGDFLHTNTHVCKAIRTCIELP